MAGSTSLPDWISSIFTAGAVGVSLWTTWLTSRQRRQDMGAAALLRENEETSRRQGVIHQISFKLATLASEASNTHRDLNPENKSPEELAQETNFFEIVGNFSPNVGYDDTMVRRLGVDEENLLMVLKEDNFLLDFCECLARHESIRRALLEYKSRRDLVLTMLPSPKLINGKTVSYFPTEEDTLKLAPYLIPLGTMVISARQLSAVNMEMLARLCDQYKPMMSKHFPNLSIHSIGLETD